MAEDSSGHSVPTVKFDTSLVTDDVKADLRQNISRIELIPTDKADEIYAAALEAIGTGGNLPIIYQALLKLDSMTKRRASEISLSLNRKASALMTIAKQKRLGLEQAVWLYSGAPCDKNDRLHKAANGKRYRIVDGFLIRGTATWPGRDDGCKCVSNPVIPGFD